MPSVSVIIPAHNAEATIAACVAACLEQPEACEVIVVDDGSTDDTARIAQELPVCYIHQEQAGPAAARNRGVREAGGGIVAFTDADCIAEPGWLEHLLRGFDEGVVATGGTYAIANDKSLLARMVHEEIALRHAAFAQDVDYLGSFNVAYRKDAFDAVGGFDEAFTQASGEDNDLAYRLHDAGGTLRFVSEARVAHYHPTRLWPYLKTQQRHGFWRVKMYVKHPGRSRGDQYAGLADFLVPPLTLVGGAQVVLFLLALFVRPTWTPTLAFTIVGMLAILALWRWPIPRRMMQRSGQVSMLLFIPVMLLRDLARGIGMLRGFWHFGVRRKGSA